LKDVSLSHLPREKRNCKHERKGKMGKSYQRHRRRLQKKRREREGGREKVLHLYSKDDEGISKKRRWRQRKRLTLLGDLTARGRGDDLLNNNREGRESGGLLLLSREGGI